MSPDDIAMPTARTARLRAMLHSPQLEFLMEAHSGLSAAIAEEAGFTGIWASGLALSAAMGVRDSNEASWTQVLETVEFMADATSVPILLDGDTGYGNFNNLRRLVTKLEQRGVAGVCIEDKVFPKTNSFINGERQPLADADEFCGKIRAGKDAQRDPDFCIVARVEALIAGWSIDEALARANAYANAGADAILIHDKARQFDNIARFAERWSGSAPLVIVPTKYYSTPTDVFRRAGISTVIWANHLVRAATTAMQNTAHEIFEAESLTGVEDGIAPVSEIFRLQGDPELRDAERRYMNEDQQPTRAVILAASRGDDLEAVTESQPKAMLDVAGQPLLQRMVNAFKSQQIDSISVVAGYRPEAINVGGIQRVDNPDFTVTGEVASLDHARRALTDDVVIAYGDVLFRKHVLADLLDSDAEIAIVVDSDQTGLEDGARDPIWASAPDDRSLFGQHSVLQHVGADNAPAAPPQGRWIGVLRARDNGCEALTAGMDRLAERGAHDQADLADLLNDIVAAGQRVDVLYIAGHWLDVNNLTDLRAAGDFAHGTPS